MIVTILLLADTVNGILLIIPHRDGVPIPPHFYGEHLREVPLATLLAHLAKQIGIPFDGNQRMSQLRKEQNRIMLGPFQATQTVVIIEITHDWYTRAERLSGLKLPGIPIEEWGALPNDVLLRAAVVSFLAANNEEEEPQEDPDDLESDDTLEAQPETTWDDN